MCINIRKTLVSIVVPFLNEEKNLPLLYDRCTQTFQNREEDLEIIFVDDGSTDNSIDWIRSISESSLNVKFVQLSRNFGHQKAITAGLDHATGDAVVIIDSDLQDPPEVIPEMLDKWHDGFHVVHAVRKHRNGETKSKKLLAHLFYRFLSAIAEVPITVDSGDFRLLDRLAVNALKDMPEQHRYLRGLASWIGFDHVTVEYDRDPRHAGTTKYRLSQSLNLAMTAITSFSGTPLRFISAIGSFLCLLSLAIALYLFVVWTILGTNPPRHAGTTYLTLAIFCVSGLQMLCIGILGQYVRRVFDEIKQRPLYLIKDSNIQPVNKGYIDGK